MSDHFITIGGYPSDHLEQLESGIEYSVWETYYETLDIEKKSEMAFQKLCKELKATLKISRFSY